MENKMAPEWKQWEGQTVNGEFPLHQYLGGREQGAVFLTEGDNRKLPRAAIKLIPSDPEMGEHQLARWEMAAQLSHPHLIRLFQMGRCHLGTKALLYVVMEFAEDDLSHLLANRPLTPTEAREMLGPVLDALAYVHDKGIVHGHLKPSNIMAVDGQLKISSDGLWRVGELPPGVEQEGIYDPPEFPTGQVSPAGDVWSLGITLVEALTRHLPVEEETQGEPIVPMTVPAPSRDFLMCCLRRDPQRRWTVADCAAHLKAFSPIISGQTVVGTERTLPRRRYTGPALAVGVLLAGVLAASQLSNRQPVALPNPSNMIEQPRVQTDAGETVSAATRQMSSLASGSVPGKVANRVLPDVPQSARDTIQGTVRVAVRVQVDQTGSVKAAEIESSGPSQYFARLALQASRLWKFLPPNVDRQDVQSEWILRFGFTRNATKVDPVQAIP